MRSNLWAGLHILLSLHVSSVVDGAAALRHLRSGLALVTPEEVQLLKEEEAKEDFPKCVWATKVFGIALASNLTTCPDKQDCRKDMGSYATFAARCGNATKAFGAYCGQKGQDYFRQAPGNAEVARVLAIVVGACAGPQAESAQKILALGAAAPPVVAGDSPCKGVCPPGKYAGGASGATGATGAGIIPLGAGSPEKGTAQDCCKCENCPAGRFSNATGATECDACPPGKSLEAPSSVDQTGATTQSSCKSCAPGKTWLQNTGCTDCPQGTFQAVAGSMGPCEKCESGKYLDPDAGATSAEACKTCKCPDGQVPENCASDSKGTCRECPQGKAGINGKCEAQCPCGKYSPNSGEASQSSCILCRPGYFSATPGRASCTACPPGKFGKDAGSCSCASCPKGKAPTGGIPADSATADSTPESRSATRTDEAGKGAGAAAGGAGRTEKGAGADEKGSPEKACTVCNSCPEGKIPGPSGLCESCPSGRASDAATGNCLDCGCGRFSPAAGASKCEPCPAGKFSAKVGGKHCSLCPPTIQSVKTGQCSCNGDGDPNDDQQEDEGGCPSHPSHPPCPKGAKRRDKNAIAEQQAAAASAAASDQAHKAEAALAAGNTELAAKEATGAIADANAAASAKLTTAKSLDPPKR